MKKTILLFFVICFTIVAQDNYKKVKVFIQDKEDISILKGADLDLDHFSFGKDKSIIFFIHESKIDELNATGFSYEVLINDWNDYYSELPKMNEKEIEFALEHTRSLNGVTGWGYGSMGGYLTMSEIYQKLNEMVAEFPNLITEKYSVGKTFENRDMYVVKISDNPNIDEDEPEVFINSLIHCREPAAMMAVLYYMYYLLENYGTNDEVTYLVDNREIYFMPLINVDGYEYNRTNSPNGGGMWRKNRRNNGDGSYGVDLNRNFGFQWGYDNNGSSPTPSSETYRGTAPFSEPETQVIRDFTESRNIKTGLNYHTYSDLLIIPWGYINEETPDSIIFREYASEMTKYNNYTWGTSGQILYEVNGDTDDWMYGEQTTKEKIISMTPEVGGSSDGFWPPQSRILPLAEENLFPNLYITWAAGDFPTPAGIEYDKDFYNPGETVYIKPSVKNKGLADANNVSVELEAVSDYLTVTNGFINFNDIPARQLVQSDEMFSLDISTLVAIGEKVSFSLNVRTGNVLVSSDTLQFIVGTPTVLFTDDGNNPEEKWNISATPPTPKWEATSDYYTAPYSYTDSKSGEYNNNATVQMVSKNPIDLTNAFSPFISFYTKFSIEDIWDKGQVLVSKNNGTTWYPLEGNYTTAGSGDGVQNLGEPLYDGNQPDWVYEQMDLSEYEGEQILIKFLLESDGFITDDGWYIDNINVYFYSPNPPIQGCADIEVNEGWNLVSLPVWLNNMNINNVFPNANSAAFFFDDYYKIASQLENDLGYWIKFPTEDVIDLCGNKIDDVIEVKAGWNIIGGNDSLISVGSVTSVPNSIIISDFFEFNDGYSIANNIVPGKGYWVRVSQDGSLKLNNEPAKQMNFNKELPQQKIIFTDLNNKKQVLYFGKEIEADMYVLPPLPPSDAFDIRFSNDTYLTSSNSSSIKLQGVQFPIKIECFNVDIMIGNKLVSAGEEIVLNDNVELIHLTKLDKNYTFNLAANYPNPFNPSTKIKFSLPESGSTSLSVFNVLGEEVAKLVNENLEAGEYTVDFNTSGTDLSSGIYIYKLISGEYSASKKMMLVK